MASISAHRLFLLASCLLPLTRASIHAVPPIVLASRSPRRADMLCQAGISFSIMPVECDESWIPHESPVDYTRRIALAKATQAIQEHSIQQVVLGADTTVWLDDDQAPLGKPADREQAAHMLRSISTSAGHWVTTAYALVDARVHEPYPTILAHQSSRVFMRPLDGLLLDTYLETREWTDKAGGYGIQGHAAAFVRRIEGSYTNIVGLPLTQLLESLESIGAGA